MNTLRAALTLSFVVSSSTACTVAPMADEALDEDVGYDDSELVIEHPDQAFSTPRLPVLAICAGANECSVVREICRFDGGEVRCELSSGCAPCDGGLTDVPPLGIEPLP